MPFFLRQLESSLSLYELWLIQTYIFLCKLVKIQPFQIDYVGLGDYQRSDAMRMRCFRAHHVSRYRRAAIWAGAQDLATTTNMLIFMSFFSKVLVFCNV